MPSKRTKANEAQHEAPAGPTEKTYALNRRARHDYVILDAFEAGIALTGPEVKSVRNGSVSLAEGYVRVENGEVWLMSVHIARYKPAAHANHEPDRARKLLVHRGEVLGLLQHLNTGGNTLVPLRVYSRAGKVKVEVGLVRGRRKYDNREKIEAKDAAREIARHVG